MLSEVESWGVASVLDVQSLIFFIKENWICAMTRHQAESNINILLTRNLPFDSGVIQWIHPFMIPLHCCGLNRTIECVVNLNVTCFVLFLFWVRSFTCTLQVLFHSLFEIERLRPRGWNNFGCTWTRGMGGLEN